MKIAKEQIADAARVLLENGAQEVYLFGSAATGNLKRGSDVDFAVKGLPPANFYRAVGAVLGVVRFPVDIVDLGDDTPFTRHLLARGNLVRVG